MQDTNRWFAPPNWPVPPPGWSPPPGWRPDQAWGPAPPGWNFWSDATDAEPGPDELAPDTAVDDEAGAAVEVTAVSSDVVTDVALGHRAACKAAKLLPRIAPHLIDGERVVAFFAANSLRPSIDFVAVTTSRLIAGQSLDLARTPLRISIDGVDIDEVQLRPAPLSRLPRISVRTRGGSAVDVSQLMYKNDEQPLRRAVADLKRQPGPPVGAARAPRQDPTALIPEKAGPIAAEAHALLDRAAEAAAAGDLDAEEQRLADVLELAGRVPLLARRDVRDWLRSQIGGEARRGRVRIGARRLGVVKPSGLGADSGRDLQ